MNNKLVFDDSYTFHTKIYYDVFNFMKNVHNRARTGTCATTSTFILLIFIYFYLKNVSCELIINSFIAIAIKV